MNIVGKVKNLGFTMIELLIVIAVLGILAVAVLAAINPIEQINRGKDTGSRSDAEQLLSAIDRFYAGKGYNPWTTGADSLNTVTYTTANPTLTQLTAADQAIGGDAQPMLQNLSSGGTSELKASFITRVTNTTYNHLFIYNDGVGSSSTYVCFLPKSASFREEAWKRCSDGNGNANTMPTDYPADGCAADATCIAASSADTATGCYICLP